MTFRCPVCDNTEYEENEGLYFCTLCNTQSQEMIRKEQVEQTYDGLSRAMFQHAHRNRYLNNKTDERRRNYGRPWSIYEAFQCIIMAQADALISLGESEDLKELTFSIWAMYLSKLGVAFCKEEKLVPDIVVQTGYGRQRELHGGTIANPFNRVKRPFNTLSTPVLTPKAKRHKLSESMSPDSSDLSDLSDLDSSDADETDTKAVRTPNPSPHDATNIIFVDESVQTSRSASLAMQSPEWMDLNKTIAFPFLALQYTNRAILPADIVRWIYEGKIPFLSMTHLLHPDMVMSGMDTMMLGVVIKKGIDVEILVKTVNKMKTYLQINNLPQPTIPLLLKRFLKDLDLPASLQGMCMELMKRTPKSHVHVRNKRIYVKLYIPALALIGLALKLLFGLDGTTEGKLSGYSTKVRDMLKSDVNIFVFDDWRRHLIKKMYSKFDINSELYRSLSTTIPSTRHPDEFLECFNNWHIEEVTRSYHKEKKVAGMSFRKGFRNVLRNPLTKLLQNGDKEKCNSTERELEMNGEHFRNSCLTHIADFLSFRESHGEKLKGKKWRTLQSDLETIMENIAYTEYNIETEEDLRKTRPNSILSLLEVFAKLGGCSVLLLDKSMVNLQNELKGKINANCE